MTCFKTKLPTTKDKSSLVREIHLEVLQAGLNEKEGLRPEVAGRTGRMVLKGFNTVAVYSRQGRVSRVQMSWEDR